MAACKKCLSECDKRIEQSLIRDGYVRVDENFIGTGMGDVGKTREAFIESCKDIPADQHCEKGVRHRRYQPFVLHPWSGTLESMPPVWDAGRKDYVTRYLQSVRINPEHGGEARGFAPLTNAQVTNLFLRSTVRRCFGVLPWRETHKPVFVGVHIIQLVAKPGAPAVSSPDLLHRDGEPYTWAFLLARVNVDGGENIIAVPEAANRHPSEVLEESVLARFTLTKPFEGWVVDDRKVSHYVSPVSLAQDAGIGWRTILLIDFSPAIPDVDG
jgi:hypothetical protein